MWLYFKLRNCFAILSAMAKFSFTQVYDFDGIFAKIFILSDFVTPHAVKSRMQNIYDHILGAWSNWPADCIKEEKTNICGHSGHFYLSFCYFTTHQTNIHKNISRHLQLAMTCDLCQECTKDLTHWELSFIKITSSKIVLRRHDSNSGSQDALGMYLAFR